LVKAQALPQIAIRYSEMCDGWLGHHCWKTPINAHRSHQNYVSLCENDALLLCRKLSEMTFVIASQFLHHKVYSHIRVP